MTDLKQKLIDLSKQATGDESIIAAGDFQPKGLTWKRAAAAGAGSLAGSELSGGNSVASGAGAASGYMLGEYLATSGNVPPVVILAASPEKLYVLTSTNAKGIVLMKELTLLDTLNRDKLSIETKQKVNVRTVVINDEETGHEYKLEGRRMVLHHMNDLLDALDTESEE